MNKSITFSMIKPGAVRRNLVGAILSQIEGHGFKIVALKMTRLTVDQAKQFYCEHKDKPFFKEVVTMMTSGPIVAMIVEKENAVEEFRELIGATDPNKASEGTIRKQFALSLTQNAIHGADSEKSVVRESSFFFKKEDCYQCPKEVSQV